MTMDRLLAEGIKDRVCILGNIDARHTLCNGTPAQARAFALDCLQKGLSTPGGHILHTSHSVHEDVKVENYVAIIAAYREFFGLEPLPG
jgi:uroporphyrinogen-III decarboxylase